MIYGHASLSLEWDTFLCFTPGQTVSHIRRIFLREYLAMGMDDKYCIISSLSIDKYDTDLQSVIRREIGSFSKWDLFICFSPSSTGVIGVSFGGKRRSPILRVFFELYSFFACSKWRNSSRDTCTTAGHILDHLEYLFQDGYVSFRVHMILLVEIYISVTDIHMGSYTLPKGYISYDIWVIEFFYVY